jgi:phosphatidylethanolamine-binding protein (PEBP) family uncharacterized protein
MERLLPGRRIPVAPGTVDKRFVTKSAKSASAGGILLALAVAALLLAGCGGGSSSDTTSASAGESGGSAAGESASGADAGSEAGGDASGEAGGGSGASAGGASGAEAGGAGSASGGGSAGGGSGTHVPQPTGEREPKITPQQREEATVADMLLQSPSASPASGGLQALPAQYTCDGKGNSPALRWQGVPQGTAELALFAMNVQPVNGKLFFDWAVGGINPDLDEMKADELPRGAVVGRNSFGKIGYEICPEGSGETYMFALFAVPSKLSPERGFEPLAFRKSVLDTSGNVGLLPLSYARG